MSVNGYIGEPADIRRFMYAQSVHTSTYAVGGTATLTPTQSGKLILVTQTAGAYVITLPSATGNAGLNYRFQIVTAAAGNTTITPASGSVIGVCISPTANVTSAGTASARFVGGTCVAGDFIDMVCDGTSWSALCVSRVNAGVVTL